MFPKQIAPKFKRNFHGKTILLATFLFFFVISIPFTSANAQVNQEPSMDAFRKNTFHGGLGFAGIIVTATMNYERMLTQNFDRKIVATFAKVGYGTYGGWTDTGQYAFVQYGFLTGKKANHLEVSAGPAFSVKGNELGFPIAFGVGYRHQKPGKPFMFRTGIAFPETLHFGLGLSF